MKTELAQFKDYEHLLTTLSAASDVITKNYLYNLEKYDVSPIPEKLKKINILDNIRLYKLKKIISDKNENILDKLVTVLNAAYTSESTVVTLIKGEKYHTDLYIGIVSKDIEQQRQDIGTQDEIFKGALMGNFPGLMLEGLKKDSLEGLCNNIFVHNCITSVSGIASLRNEKEKNIERYVQGIEHLIDSLQGKEEYSILFIADPVSIEDINLAKAGYENIYTQLVPLAKNSISLNESDSLNLSQSQTFGITTSIGKSVSLTQGYSETTGWGSGESKSKQIGSKIGNVLGVVGGIAAAYFGGVDPVTATSLGSAIGGTLGAAVGKDKSQNASKNSGISDSINLNEGTNISEGEQYSDTEGITVGKTKGKTYQLTNENKTVKNLLSKIDKHIERLNKCKAFGGFNCSTYIISPSPEVNAIIASGYNALMRGDNSALQASYINNWYSDDENMKKIKEYLKIFSHPLFTKRDYEEIALTPALMENAYEVAINLGLPKKSVNGICVVEAASFGRNVLPVVEKYSGGKKIHLGQVQHMGVTEKGTTVDLDVDSLTMHTFVTGSTGSGKSNTIYQLITEFMKQKIPFLVIEPAKGEYKDVFGNREDVNVFSTNPNVAAMINLNPFKFPKAIHVLEHVDGLVEIFSVCWPMYDAMPSFFKEAILKSYEAVGWDLGTSVYDGDNIEYPNFEVLVEQLNHLIDSSAYSEEVKSNYRGALVTRVKSLTVGLNKYIFTAEQTPYEKIFDENCIIDISRVKSSETKALIMGMMIYILNEYRVENKIRNNSGLKHITVLEEAHNILKRKTEGDSQLMGKSVEMLTQTIAEIRTFGEGFVIVDQSPSSVDISAIKNTNTKIVLRIPEVDDRKAIGYSMGLNESQIDEISKLPNGVAVIYQNDWVTPVLAKVDKAGVEEGIYKFEQKNKIMPKKKARKYILEMLMQPWIGINKIHEDILREALKALEVSNVYRKEIELLIEDYILFGWELVWEEKDLIKLQKLVKSVLGISKYEINKIQNTDELKEYVFSNVKDITKEQVEEICKILLWK